MPEVTPLPPELLRRVSALARSLVAAARTWTLYPAEHPAVRTALDRLVESARQLTSDKTLRLQATPETLVITGTPLPTGDQGVRDLAELLHRHLVGAITIHPAADGASWRALLVLLSRPHEQVHADGGIARLWANAGSPGIEIREIDYARSERILAVLQRNEAPQFDPHLVRRFVQLLGIYPPGNLVKLNTGEVAVVLQVHAPDPYRPRVRVLFGPDGAKLDRPIERNLFDPTVAAEQHVVAPVDPAQYGIDTLSLLT